MCDRKRFTSESFGEVLFAAFCLLMGVLCMFFSPSAHAACVWSGRELRCSGDEGEAYAALSGHLAGVMAEAQAANPTTSYLMCFERNESQKHWAGSVDANQCDTSFNFGAFWSGGSCSGRSPETGWATDGNPQTEDKRCHNGCTYVETLVIPEGYTQFVPTGTVCKVGDAPAPSLDTDQDGEPDETDWAPTDPTEQKDSDGDGIGDNADTADDDATNGNDGGDTGSPGDEPGGGPGDETDNRAEGGGTCAAPPACSGDGIQCNILYQTWKGRCAAEQTAANTSGEGAGGGDGDGDGTVTGGTCGQPYVCTGGDPVACAALNEQHKLRCGLVPDGDEGELDYGPDGEPGSLFGSLNVLDGFSFDDEGWLGGGACPVDSLRVGSESVDFQPLCDGASVLGFYVLMLGFLHGMWVIGQSVARAG